MMRATKYLHLDEDQVLEAIKRYIRQEGYYPTRDVSITVTTPLVVHAKVITDPWFAMDRPYEVALQNRDLAGCVYESLRAFVTASDAKNVSIHPSSSSYRPPGTLTHMTRAYHNRSPNIHNMFLAAAEDLRKRLKELGIEKSEDEKIEEEAIREGKVGEANELARDNRRPLSQSVGGGSGSADQDS